MILKPFMLRRIKKDVENELSDKVCSVSCRLHSDTLKIYVQMISLLEFSCFLFPMLYVDFKLLLETAI